MVDANEINIEKAKKLVADNRIQTGDYDEEFITTDDIYVVWFTKTLQNWKALLSSDAWDDSSYYEVTYNGDREEAYVDWYKKVSNTAVPD